MPSKTNSSSYIEKSSKINNQQGCVKVVRSVWYFIGFILLILVTVLIFFSLVTNNWQVSINVQNNGDYYTAGLWLKCRHVKVSWLNKPEDVYCSLNISSKTK